MTAADRIAQIRARVEAAFEDQGDANREAEAARAAASDAAALLAAVEAVLSISTETIAASLALSRGSHVSPPRGGADYRAAEAVVDLIHDAIEGALS